MHHKAIKREVQKQLKKNFPKWKLLPRKEKKQISQQVLEEVTNDYNFEDPIKEDKDELLGIDNQSYQPGIMNLDEMDSFVESIESWRLFDFHNIKQHKAIKDYELKLIDELINDEVINKLLSYDGYSPAMREFLPSLFFRAELLKSIKFPEVSYRKYCGDDKNYAGHKETSPYLGMECKQNRAFIGLPLNRKKMISHIQLSQFRSGITFVQAVNLMVYFLTIARKSGLLDSHTLHCVDSTELPVDRHHLLASLTIKGKRIRIYDDIDCDCGKRRNKRDKSIYVVGYRMHTLTALNPETGHSIPLISILAAANHHDSHFLGPLISLGNSIGLNVNLVSADEAYHDKTSEIYTKHGTSVITPENSKVKLPVNVDDETLAVTMNNFCEIPMSYIGTEGSAHEFKCAAEPGECFRSSICPQYRHIPFDQGCFQRLLSADPLFKDVLDLRKNCERPFNLMKKREGLEELRVRSQNSAIARAAFTTISTLLIEIIETRKKGGNKKLKYRQERFFDAA